MPELPEVQTVINYLKPKLKNKAITSINLLFNKVVKNSTPNNFINYLINEKFLDIERKGKYLIFHLSNNKSLVIHLRMEGKLFIQPKQSLPNFPQLICQFSLDDNNELRFYDTRKFGTFEIIKTSEWQTLPSIQKLAMDANSSEFTSNYLYEISRKSSQAIKTFLLDQSNVAGLGNIYVNEVLFASSVLPQRKANSLNLDECHKIVENSKLILNTSIKYNGTTIHTYKFSEYDCGGYQKFLKVHTKSKQKCLNCESLIKFTKVNGRGTYFCEKCQK